MAGRYLSQLLSSYNFKEWTTENGALKKIHCLSKNLMLQIDPLSSSFPKNYSTRKKTQAVSSPEEQLFGENSCSESHP